MVLFNPVLRMDLPQLLGFVGNDEALAKAISPTLYLTKDTPPTLLLYGSADRLAAQGEEFMKKSKELGHRAEMFTAEGQGHGFFNRPPWQEKTAQRMDEFLVSIGYLQASRLGSRDRATIQKGYTMRKICIAAVLSALFFTSANRAPAADPTPQNACELNRTIKVTMKYLLCLPKDYEQKPSWPLLLFLHGSGNGETT